MEKEKTNFWQKLVMILAKKSGLEVDTSNKIISNPKVTREDAALIGTLEAENAKLRAEKSNQKPASKKEASLPYPLSIFDKEHELPKGKIKILQGIDGQIGTEFRNWYVDYSDGSEKVWFVVAMGKQLHFFGGHSMKDSLNSDTLDLNQPILQVRFSQKGKYIPKRYLSIDQVPNINKNMEITQAESLIKSLTEILKQNVEAKDTLYKDLPLVLDKMKKEYTDLINQSLSDIKKQEMEIEKLKEEREKLRTLVSQYSAKNKELTRKLSKQEEEEELGLKDLEDIKDEDKK